MYFLSGDLTNYFKELDKILENNVPSVWVIRALIRYHINIYVCIKKIAFGTSMEASVESLSPPIFFKYKPMFKKALSNFTEDKVCDNLKKLYEAEKAIKSGASSDKQILSKIFF
jgi:DNA polymerase-3 subunit delta